MNRAVVVLIVVVLIVAMVSRSDADPLDGRTLEKLEQALSCVNLSIRDLGWDKRPIDDEFRLSCVNEALDRPLALADRAVRAETEFAADPVASARAAAGWLDVTLLPPYEPSSRADERRFPGAPREAARLLELLVRAYEEAGRWRDDAMSALTAEERKLLSESGPRLYTDESQEEWDMTPVLAAARKIDIGKLVNAELVLAEASRAVRSSSRGLDTSRWKRRTWRIGAITVGLGGPGPDSHSETVALDPGGDDVYTAGSIVLDLAGNDVYRDVGKGLLDVALIVDLAGDDRYQGKDFVQGGAAFGVSLLVDAAGDDRYEADQCSQGSAFFGVGMLFDLAGSDAYRGARFVQGFGGTRGLGVLSDVAGNDTYYAGGKYLHAPLLPENYQSLSQGFGFGLRGANSSGGVGVLADHAGNDVYSGEVFGQGASYWFSLGILVDSSGHDKYDLYQYGQGAGIHLSAGVLFDRAGNDAYSCNNGVAQGSGHDWGVGLLWDLAGDDCYQGSGMSQGGANANGIGMLIDRAGNDSYAGWNVKNQGDSFFSRGTIGLGVLLDLAGKDRYTHGGADETIWTRGTVGVGLDSDESAKKPAGSVRHAAPISPTAGTSFAPTNAASGTQVPSVASPASPTVSPVRAGPLPAPTILAAGSLPPDPSPASPTVSPVRAGPLPAPTILAAGSLPPDASTARRTVSSVRAGPSPAPAILAAGWAITAPAPSGADDLEALWHDSCLWEVGSNTSKVPEARRRLIATGDRALDFLIPSKLETKDTLVTRALNVVITGIGQGAVERLLPCLDSDKPDVRRNAADLLGALGATKAAPAIAKLLKDPDARLGALAALGQLKSPAAVPQIIGLMESDAPERVRYTAAATLGAIGGEDGIRALVKQLASPASPMRYAAQFALEGLKATGPLRARLGDPDLRVRLHAIAALGHIADRSARSDLLRLLDDPSPVVRGFAAEALGSMLDPSDRAHLEARLAAEADPFAHGKLAAALGPK